MATELAIPKIALTRHEPEPAQDPRAASHSPPTKMGARPPEPAPMNPALSFDPLTGLAIMEFRDKSGEVSSTIPSKRQIDAYRRGIEASPPAPQPVLESR